MKTVYSEHARLSKYSYYNDGQYNGIVTANFSAKFDEREQVIKLNYRTFLDVNSHFMEKTLKIQPEYIEVHYLHHINKLVADFEHNQKQPTRHTKICVLSDGRFWRWLASKANNHYDKTIKAIKEWATLHMIEEGETPTEEKFLFWVEAPSVKLVPQSD